MAGCPSPALIRVRKGGSRPGAPGTIQGATAGLSKTCCRPGSDEFRDHGAFFVELRFHPARNTFGFELGFVFLAQERVFHPVWNRCAPFRNVHRGVIGMPFTGWARLAAWIVRPEPGGEAK